MYNKKSTGKISSIHEDKQELNTNRKKKKEEDFKKELEELRINIKEKKDCCNRK